MVKTINLFFLIIFYMEGSFIQRLNIYRTDLAKVKNNPKFAQAWGPTQEKLQQEIMNYRQMAYNIGEDAAEEHFNANCILADYPTVMDYMSAVSLDVMRYANKTSSRTKTKRLSSKITSCKVCGGKVHISGKSVICDECGEIEPIVSKTGKSKSNNIKHTKNKIECLIGMMDPPHKIIEIEKYAAEWLLHMKWLYDWLEYKEKTFVMMKSDFTKEKWLNNLHEKYSLHPRDEKGIWSMDIKPIEKYRWRFAEYKLIITEFHAMLCECDRLAANEFLITNMISLNQDKQLPILKAYYEENKRVPQPKETYVYNDVTYDIGNFINMIKLTHREDDFKKEIDDIFNENIRLPGLMFDFLSLSSKKAIDRFTLTEAYSYIIHKTFQFPFMNIPSSDIEKMLELIQHFDLWMNEYATKYKPKSTELKKNNSKLYTCKLQCILKLPYFYKYIELVTFLPEKGEDTVASIQRYWRIFIVARENHDIIEPYLKEYEEADESKIESRSIFPGLI